MFNNEDEENQDCFNTRSVRPDIVSIDRDGRNVIITEIAIPFDCHIKKCYQEKFNKYFPLSLEINSLGYRTQIVILIIGSLGNVHKKFQTGLKINGICKTEAKFLSKFCSTSAMYGSFFAWKQRCRLSPRVD